MGILTVRGSAAKSEAPLRRELEDKWGFNSLSAENGCFHYAKEWREDGDCLHTFDLECRMKSLRLIILGVAAQLWGVLCAADLCV